MANNTLNNLLLCSKPEYWENLELSGVDAIGLSGNHMNDFGYDNFDWTMDFYMEKKIPYYAGGKTDEEARKPLILEQNGNRLGFIGANSWGPEYYWNANGEKVSAWAGKENPGAARFDLTQMQADIQALKPQVDLVFGEVQHTEFNAAGDYQTEPIPQQETDFRGMIDAGADVVTGVMAHAPQAVETAGRQADPVRPGQPLFRPDLELADADRPGCPAHDLQGQADQYRAAGDGHREQLPAPLGHARGADAGAEERV